MWRNARRAGFLKCVLLLACVQPLSASVPEWLTQAKAQPAETYPPDISAEVLLDQTDITVTGPGEYQEHSRWIVRILRPDGREEGNLWLHLAQHDKLSSIHAWTIDSSGREYELKDKDFTERGSYNYELYDDIRYRYALAPAAAPGSVIAFEYDVRRHVFVDQFHWWFQEESPVREARLTVTLPPGWEYKTSWAGAAAVQPAAAGDNRWQWTVRAVPGIEREPMRPFFWALCSRMELAYFGPGAVRVSSWEGLGRWYIGLTSDRRNPTPELKEKALQLTAGHPDFDGKLRSLASFMQSEVRYVAIEIGIGGFQPHAAGDIFRARYGDCKDKATLLSTMLREVGINSDYVIINTHRGVADPALPSTGSFNHAILAIELPREIPEGAYQSVITAKTGKRYLIFDPTDEYTPIGELRSELQDTYALLVADNGGELIHTPVQPPDTNRLTRTGHFVLSPDGSLAGEVVENRSGDHASSERAALFHANQQERVQHWESFLNRSMKGFTLQATNVQQLDQLQQNLVLTFKIATPLYGQVRGPLMLVRPRVLGEKSFRVETKPRHYPFELLGASRETDSYELEIPAEYKVDDIPDPVNIDVGFASYRSKTEVAGSKLRYTRELVIRDVRVGPDRTADLRKFEGTIGADEEAAVVLKRAQ